MFILWPSRWKNVILNLSQRSPQKWKERNVVALIYSSDFGGCSEWERKYLSAKKIKLKRKRDKHTRIAFRSCGNWFGECLIYTRKSPRINQRKNNGRKKASNQLNSHFISCASRHNKEMFYLRRKLETCRLMIYERVSALQRNVLCVFGWLNIFFMFAVDTGRRINSDESSYIPYPQIYNTAAQTIDICFKWTDIKTTRQLKEREQRELLRSLARAREMQRKFIIGQLMRTGWKLDILLNVLWHGFSFHQWQKGGTKDDGNEERSWKPSSD